MANENGNQKTLRWLLVVLWGLTMSIGGVAWALTKDRMSDNAANASEAQKTATQNSARIDSLNYQMMEMKLEQRVGRKEQNIQLEEIAKAVNAKVTIDSQTVVVDTVIVRVKDST